MSELVSVLFPVGPGKRPVREALHDLLAQTWNEIEILALLNGCTDESRAVVSSCSDPRLRIIDRGDHPDLLGALQAGVVKSQGAWLARMDTDDRCAPERIAETLALLRRGDCEVASCGIQLIGAQGAGMQRYVDWVNGLTEPVAVARERFIESPVVQPTVIVAKEKLLAAGGYHDDGLAEDYSLWLRFLQRGYRFGKVSAALYFWHDHRERLTRSHARYHQKAMLRLKAEALSQLPIVQERGVAFCGAGPIGKTLARELLGHGVSVHGFFEVDPKRVGRTCQGRPIAGPEEFGTRWRHAVLLSAVGIVGGRERVRVLAQDAGYCEGEDFFCCC